MTNTDKQILAIIGIIFIPILLLSNGFALYKYYNWFVLEAFPSLTAIGYFHAVGLHMFTLFFKNIRPLEKESGFEEQVKNLVTKAATPWATLGLGWIMKEIMFG
jgi:hypothetical protein